MTIQPHADKAQNPHKIVTVDKSTPWREFSAELTDYQRGQMERTEDCYRDAGVLDAPESQQALLGFTLDYINENRIAADYAHVPVPEGATLAPGDGWEASYADPTDYSRPLMWAEFDTGVPHVGLDISGRQSTDGSCTRSILLYADGSQMDAHQARQLAQALIEAANKLESLA